jgi:hypothetical protein
VKSKNGIILSPKDETPCKAFTGLFHPDRGLVQINNFIEKPL